MSIQADWAEPNNRNKQADYNAQGEYLNSTIGWFTQPLITGDYPEDVKKTFEGMIPTFSAEEAALVKGATDFLAIDHITTYYVRFELNLSLWFIDFRKYISVLVASKVAKVF